MPVEPSLRAPAVAKRGVARPRCLATVVWGLLFGILVSAVMGATFGGSVTLGDPSGFGWAGFLIGAYLGPIIGILPVVAVDAIVVAHLIGAHLDAHEVGPVRESLGRAFLIGQGIVLFLCSVVVTTADGPGRAAIAVGVLAAGHLVALGVFRLAAHVMARSWVASVRRAEIRSARPTAASARPGTASGGPPGGRSSHG